MVGEDDDGVFACLEAENRSVLEIPGMELPVGECFGHREDVSQEGEARGPWWEGFSSYVGDDVAGEKCGGDDCESNPSFIMAKNYRQWFNHIA